MKRKLIKVLIILNLFCVLKAQSQEIKIEGRVIESSKRTPLEGVLVVLKSIEKNTIFGFTQTTSNGEFLLKTDTIKQDAKLLFSLLGYSSVEVIYSLQDKLSEVLLDEKKISIKEVTIKAPPVRKYGDTITYSVANFAQSHDRTIGDVLKKIPGIEVGESGIVKHNGLPISKFYIEGLDLLEGRYGIATNGIPRQNIQSIEVLENHQPKKIFKDFIRPENSAINLKLTEASKSQWIGTAQTGLGGMPFLWNSELLGMRFARKSQSITTYKSNNTGTDVISETQSFNLEDLLKSESRYYPVNYIEPPFINTKSTLDEDRMRFNKTHVFSSTQLWNISRDYEMKGQLVYARNKLEGNSVVSNHYFLPNDTVVIEEQKKASSLHDKLDFGFIVSANTEKKFLKNKFTSNFNWNTTDLLVSGTYPSVQQSKLPDILMANSFEFTKKINRQFVDIDVYTMFFSKDHSLTVRKSEKINQQQVNSSGVFSNVSAAYRLNYNRWTLSLQGGLSFLARKMENYLQGNALPENIQSGSFDTSVSYFCPNLKPTLEYRKKSLNASLKLNVNYLHYRYGDEMKDLKANDLLAVSPEFSFRYYFSSKLSGLIAVGIKTNPVEEKNLYEGFIMQNYLSFQKGLTSLVNEKSKSGFLGFYYKDPINLFHANASVSRIWDLSPRIANRTFMGNYILNSFLQHQKKNEIWRIDGRLSKGIDFCKGVLTAQTSYSSLESAMLQQGQYTSFVTDMFFIKPGVTAQLTHYANVEYAFNYFKYVFYNPYVNEKMKNAQMQHEFRCNILPFKKMQIFVKGEYYKNDIKEGLRKAFLIMDGGANYRISKACEITVSLLNVLGEKQYSYTVSEDLREVFRQYTIRPRNVLISLSVQL